MANFIIGYPNRVDGGTLSGGSWATALPLSNLQNRDLSKVARTNNALASSTTFDGDLGASYKIKSVTVSAHNFSATASWRVQLANSAAFASGYDSGSLSAYPTFYPATQTLWGEDVGGTALSTTEIAGGHTLDAIHVLATTVTYRYYRLTVTDTGNSDGYIQAGRAFAGFGYQPSNNFRYDATFGYEDPSERWETDGGSFIYRDKTRRRVATLQVANIPTDEAWVEALEVARKLGTTQQFQFIFNPADTIHMQRRSFSATIRELSPLEINYQAGARTGFRIVEDL